MATAEKVKCVKCNGLGRIDRYSEIARGVCFDCKGEGFFTLSASQVSKTERELAEAAESAKKGIERVLKEAWKLRKLIDAGKDTTGELKQDLKELEHYYRELKTFL